MNKAALLIGVAGLCLFAQGCVGRLDHLTRAPSMTAPGAPREAVPPAAPSRLELARYSKPDSDEPGSSGSLWRSGPTSLFGDRRARILGDILTVVIEIDDEAEIRNQTSRTRDSAEGLSIPNFFGLPGLAADVLPSNGTLNPAIDIASNSSAGGNGDIRREEKLTLQIAATVVNILPNGHMVITGSQEVRVNHELRDLQVAGIIRPEDISRRNTITSKKSRMRASFTADAA